jgi:hypothetical protein
MYMYSRLPEERACSPFSATFLAQSNTTQQSHASLSSHDPEAANLAADAQSPSFPTAPHAQPSTVNPKGQYNPQHNKLGAQQNYSMNRFLDEIPDFRAQGFFSKDLGVGIRNKRHRAALRTKVRKLEMIIDG